MKAIVWGTGKIAKDCYLKKVLYREFDIIAFTDNNSLLWNAEFYKTIVVPPAEILTLKFDAVLIWSSHIEDITNQLINEFHIDRQIIYTYQDLEKKLCLDLEEKYKNSADIQLRKVIEYYHHKGFNIFGCYEGLNIPYLVERDSDGWPFISIEGKKMFYPKQYSFDQFEGREYIYNVLYEQGDNSPHRYVIKEDIIPYESIIVDAGVCEGNFALRYVDKAKKLYLIESDPKWMGALRKTFEEYKDKVVFCPKYLTRYDSKDTITLDTLVEENIDFLKMDIEGAEIDALLGGKRVLQRSNARCAICSYHKQNDADNISWIMKNLGYQTFNSEGYMFFVYDKCISDSLDFRKGIVYANKI